MTKSYTANPEAYQDYLKGRYWWNKLTLEGLNKSIEYFQQAIAKDPTYALAYSGLADSYSLFSGLGLMPPKGALPRAKEAALKAVELDGTLAEAHAALGDVRDAYDWDRSGAESEYKRAIELNPGYVLTYRRYGLLLGEMGRREEAIAQEKRAVELDPLSVGDNRLLGLEFYLARQYDQAIDECRKTLELDPNFAWAYLDCGAAYVQKSMYKEGIAELEKALAISPDNTQALSHIGYAYAVAGRSAEAHMVLDRLNELSKRRYVPAEDRAGIHAGLGEKEKALEWLEKGFDDHSLAFGVLFDAIFDPLRSDPRFADLLRRMNLQP
jgi:tetratricopeptide (TPR) repeat protein